ncbi:MAG: hypothetical protein WBP79_02035 [Candidatus Acidiferrales bacterium]
MRTLPSRRAIRAGSSQSGYAYLMALFLVLIVLATSIGVIKNLATEGRRQREEEMIWRGEQYVRAIRIYFHKTGHYPQTLDDLEKGLPQLHFLRQTYKDPMNKEDGKWRFIYVNAAGQIIGSVRYASLQQMTLLNQGAGQMPTAQPGQPGIPALSLTSGGSNPGTPPDQNASSGQPQNPNQDQSGQNPQNSNNPPNPQNPPVAGQPVQAGGPTGGLTGQTGNPLLDMKPTGPVDGPVIGAFLTGVASKVDKSSLKVYSGGKKYKEWEFIWNPLDDQAKAMQQGLTGQGAPGQGIGIPLGAPGTNPFGNPGGGPVGGPGGLLPTQPQPQQSQPQQ